MPAFVRALPATPLMTPERVAKSVVVVPLSKTFTVRSAPFRLIGLEIVTSDSAVVEFR